MAGEIQHTVAILYEHALLGEGIATYLRAQTGVEVTLGCANDPTAVASALALGPDVVILESNDPVQLDLSTRIPRAVLIDLSAVISRGPVSMGTTPGLPGLGQILQSIRESSFGESSLRESSLRESSLRESSFSENSPVACPGAPETCQGNLSAVSSPGNPTAGSQVG